MIWEYLFGPEIAPTLSDICTVVVYCTAMSMFFDWMRRA